MQENRNATQILFNYLPLQTSDLRGRIWKVEKWVSPRPLRVDPEALRRRFLSVIEPWRISELDSGLAEKTRNGSLGIEIVGVNPEEGVRVEAWPNIWQCKECRRLVRKKSTCRCGEKKWAQLPYVAFHHCGYLGEPHLPLCKNHGEAKADFTPSTRIQDFEITCPVCAKRLSKGLGSHMPCPGCGESGLVVNIHRASSVFTPYTMTMVNPARPQQLEELLKGGGKEKSLRWILTEMKTSRPEELPQTRNSLSADLLQSGIPSAVVEQMLKTLDKAGGSSLIPDGEPLQFQSEAKRERAEDAATEVALAAFEGRVSASSLAATTMQGLTSTLYRNEYAESIQRAGLADVDFMDRFPVLRGVFGFTRGGNPPGESRLIPFKGYRNSVRVYADSNETEALYFRLDPVKVVHWLHSQGLIDDIISDPIEARMYVINCAEFPDRGDDVTEIHMGSEILKLLHSYSHRVIRTLSVLAGIDRDALSEYLIPEHLGFFIYASPRGQFVLGGLQAVFETSLNRLLDQLIGGESRCPLDPGCDRNSGACAACLHIGEPSCSHYNAHLSRRTLFGDVGYFVLEAN